MKENKLKIVVKILAILIIILISFFGIYKQDLNRMKNIIKPYNYVNDLVGYRELLFNPKNSDSDSVEEEGEKKQQNFDKEKIDKTKSIFKNRLKKFGVEDYTIAANYDDGSIYLKIPEDENTDHTISNIMQVGKFEIKDKDDEAKVLLSNNDLKKVLVYYNTLESGGTVVNLKIEFNEHGKNILKEISTGEYATKQEEVENSTTETTEDQSESNTDAELNAEENIDVEENETETETQKQIVMAIDDNDLITTSFDEPVETGVLGMTMNAATTDEDTIKNSLQYGSTISTILNSGVLPFEYTVVENVYTKTDINLSLFIKIAILLTIISLILLIIKYKGKGAIASICYIGYIALILLVVRYTNVQNTLESLVCGIILLLINYIIICNLLKIKETSLELKNKKIANVFKDIILKLIPLLIVSIIFVFTKLTKISSFGMVAFWGVSLSLIYNFTITKKLINYY